jgi:hypothetical protein
MIKLNLFLVTIFVFKLTYAQGPGIGGGGGIGDGLKAGVVVIDKDFSGDFVIDWSGSGVDFKGTNPVTVIEDGSVNYGINTVAEDYDSSAIGKAAISASEMDLDLANQMLESFRSNPKHVFKISPETFETATKKQIEETVIMMGIKNSYLSDMG